MTPNTTPGTTTATRWATRASTTPRPRTPSNDRPPTPTPPTLGGKSDGTLFDQSINGNPYYTQSLWSNGDLNCHLEPALGTISPSFTNTAPVTAGTAVSFDPSAGTSTNGYSSVTWNWGDRTTSFSTGSLTAVRHKYAAARVYSVSLTLVDTQGNIATVFRQLVVDAAPTPAFTIATQGRVTGDPVALDASRSRDPGYPIVFYFWSFGDRSFGQGVQRYHVYTRAGTYVVTLAIGDDAGRVDFITHAITVRNAKITSISVAHRSRHGATLLVKVDAPGRLWAYDNWSRLTKPGETKLPLRLTTAQQLQLSRTGSLRVHRRVEFVPTDGRSSAVKLTVTLHS